LIVTRKDTTHNGQRIKIRIYKSREIVSDSNNSIQLERKTTNVGYEHYKNVYDFRDNMQTLTMHMHSNSNKTDCIKNITLQDIHKASCIKSISQ